MASTTLFTTYSIARATAQHYFASFFSDFATAGTAPSYKGGARLGAEIHVRGSCPKGLSRKLGRFDIHASTEGSAPAAGRGATFHPLLFAFPVVLPLWHNVPSLNHTPSILFRWPSHF
jgi:hypothetical protein